MRAKAARCNYRAPAWPARGPQQVRDGVIEPDPFLAAMVAAGIPVTLSTDAHFTFHFARRPCVPSLPAHRPRPGACSLQEDKRSGCPAGQSDFWLERRDCAHRTWPAFWTAWIDALSLGPSLLWYPPLTRLTGGPRLKSSRRRPPRHCLSFPLLHTSLDTNAQLHHQPHAPPTLVQTPPIHLDTVDTKRALAQDVNSEPNRSLHEVLTAQSVLSPSRFFFLCCFFCALYCSSRCLQLVVSRSNVFSFLFVVCLL